MKAVCLISHGSRYSETIGEVRTLVETLRKTVDAAFINYAFLELAAPNIPDGIEACIAAGADEVVVLLNFLNAGRHVDHDIPRIVEGVRRKHPAVKITITPPVGQHAQIPKLFSDLINRA